jgi:hypothetical protein
LVIRDRCEEGGERPVTSDLREEKRCERTDTLGLERSMRDKRERKVQIRHRVNLRTQPVTMSCGPLDNDFAKSREQRTESKGQRAESREQRAESGIGLSTSTGAVVTMSWSTKQISSVVTYTHVEGCYKSVVMVLQGCYRNVTRVLKACFTGY